MVWCVLSRVLVGSSRMWKSSLVRRMLWVWLGEFMKAVKLVGQVWNIFVHYVKRYEFHRKNESC